ncbi:membrane dipeptidase [Runella defluvii]|uniref:Membrane dipeptidase n=1 Tax=Runella defluvii TaxID=370973 RepID=A0A7W6ERS9_9BACT|nr:dipeptidase [Runella defluvii]MBB3839985.1 membrane dipeptidase [Runella defluvii]
MKHLIITVFALLFVQLSGAAQNQSYLKEVEKKEMTDEWFRKKADELAHKYILTDGHVDLPYRLKIKNFRLEREYLGIPLKTTEGDFDYERAKKGGLSAPFMSIYIPSSYQQTGGAKELADSLINMVRGIATAHPDKFGIVTTPKEADANFKKGVISFPMGMENGAPLQTISDVAYFRKKGISYVTLTHGKDNLICDSSYDTTHTHKGLSAYGRDVVKEMNRVGIMVDISHVSDDAFYQAIELSSVPVIASHSSCRYFTPTFKRNMSDDMIKLLAKKGGVIQINFGSSFLDEKYRQQIEALQDKFGQALKEKGIKMGSPEADEFQKQFQKENPVLFADVETVADHIDHVVKLTGSTKHVGIGSDFDGVGDSLPTGLKDVSQYPNLFYVLLKRGYTESDIANIMYKNVWRVWQKTVDNATVRR